MLSVGWHVPEGRALAAALVKEGKAPKFGGAFSPGGSLLLSPCSRRPTRALQRRGLLRRARDPTLPRYNRVVYGGFATAVGFFVAIAAAARTFGAASRGLILNSFAGADKLATPRARWWARSPRARTPYCSRACARLF